MSDLNNNFIGRKFFRFLNLGGLDVNRYFDCLRTIKPLLIGEDFNNSISGFYVSRISNEDSRVSVRLVYFTFDINKTKNTVDQFIQTNSQVALFNSLDSTDGIAGNAAGETSEEESRFRRFANVYTNIGLDLLDQNILPQ